MIAMRAGTKRARPTTAKPQDDGEDVRMEDAADGNQRGSPAPEGLAGEWDGQGRDGDGMGEQEEEEERARRKRAMRVRADLRFLEKLPTLSAYQRGRFGRRGGVDGGAPAGDASLWMRALERSLEETSFVTGEAPARAALVAPLACAPRAYGPTPATPAPTPVHRALPPHGLRAGVSANAVRFAGYVAVAPAGGARRPSAVLAGSGKDDEARAADM
jgi:hypothetical protein